MATFSWTRKFTTAVAWSGTQQHALLVSLTAGQTIIKNIVSWGFAGNTSTTIIPTATMGNVAALGIVTTVGNRTETPPDPITAPNNAADPTQRWLYWEVRAPVVESWDIGHTTAIWTSSPSNQPIETEAQVLAPSTMGVGNTLNLWMSVDEQAGWDASGQAIFWFASQTLIRSP